MILDSYHAGHPAKNGFFHGRMSEARVGLVILVGLAVIAATVTGLAIAAYLGVGPNLGAIAYLLLALSAAALLFTYMITFIGNEIRAGLYMVAFWMITLAGVYVLFYAFG